MPILSNQGRTIPELPSLIAGNINNSDYLIIQSLSSNSTKKTTVSEFSSKAASVIVGLNNLNFVGPNNRFTGSIRSVENDTYSTLGAGVPNILKRLKVTDYLEVGSTTKTTNLTIFSSIIAIDQTSGGSISIQGNAANSDILVLNYPAGFTLVNTPFTGENITATTGFTGDLVGNVTGDIASSGESSFNDIVSTGVHTSAASVIESVVINGGSIDGTTIGTTSANRIVGTQITASTGFKGNLKGNVTGNLTGDVTSTTINATNIIGGTYYGDVVGGTINATGFSGDLTGDVKTPTGNTVLQNGTDRANQSSFYGTASYSRNGSYFSSYSSSFASRTSFAVSSSHTLTASYALLSNPKLAQTASRLNWSALRPNGTASYSYNGEQKYSSYSSSYARTSTFASSSNYSVTSLSASYALMAITIDPNAAVAYADTAGSTLLSDISLSSSYLAISNKESYKFTYFDSVGLTNSPHFSYLPQYNQYYISGSTYPELWMILDSKQSNNYVQSNLVLSNNINRSRRVPTYNLGPEAWRLTVGESGSFSLNTYTGSYQFQNPNYLPKGINPYFSAIKQINNCFYFWPEPFSYSSIVRDASIAIGVNTPDGPKDIPYSKAKLHIRVFSASIDDYGKGAWSGAGTTRNLSTAILVQYGSGSIGQPIRDTFYVSGSGNVYTAGTIRSVKGITGSFLGTSPYRIYGKSNVSFWGTGSNSVSSSVSVNSFSSSYAVTSSHVPYLSETIYNNISIANFIWDTSNGGVQTSNGTAYSFNPLTNVNGKLLKFFRIEGSIKAVASPAGYYINGVKIGGPAGTLVTSARCSWGWGRTFTPTTSEYRVSFTIEGPVPLDYATGTVQFTIYGPAGIQNYLEGYVIGFY